jgi:hypothetical protein
MRQSLTLFFCLCVFAIENRHFRTVNLGLLTLNDDNSLKFVLQGYIKSIA